MDDASRFCDSIHLTSFLRDTGDAIDPNAKDDHLRRRRILNDARFNWSKQRKALGELAQDSRPLEFVMDFSKVPKRNGAAPI